MSILLTACSNLNVQRDAVSQKAEQEIFNETISSDTIAKPLTLNVNEIAIIADEIATQYFNLGWFSGVVLVAHQGKPIYEKSFGLADR